MEKRREKDVISQPWRESYPPIIFIAGVYNQGGQWAGILCQGTDPHTHKWNMMGSPSLSAADITHMLNVPSHTALCLGMLCVFGRWICVLERIGSWVNHCITPPDTRAHTHTHIDTVIGPMPTHGGAYASLDASTLSPCLSQTHTDTHTLTNHVEQWLQLERVFSWLSVQFSGRAKCGS